MYCDHIAETLVGEDSDDSIMNMFVKHIKKAYDDHLEDDEDVWKHMTVMLLFFCFQSSAHFSQHTRSSIIIDLLMKTRKKTFSKKKLFLQIYFFSKKFSKCFLKKIKKMFFLSKKILCCPQKVTRFCSKKKKRKNCI